jgi:uncharacterized delta-60 repeat protein
MKKQHKLLLLFFMLTSFLKSYSQQYEINLSPEGKFETVYDNHGNVLKLKNILINAPKELGYLRATAITCSNTSYFNLYFEPDCGMEDTSNPTHNARRAVMCKVFEDISNFITSPLSTTGNKVNIWVRNIANVNAPTGTLGLASTFYVPNTNITNTVGGILDGEIWKTIHTGVDSYTNVIGGTNNFYHGTVAVNFNDPSINWNTNLAINSPSNLYDLYTVMLHEVVHSLGFSSLINQNGASITPSPFYSRYDTFLRTNNIPLLTIGSCSMYDVSFNSAVSPTVLRPGCTLPNNISNGVLNTTSCANSIKYVGSSTVPVYTPTCFEQGSSLSHLEDMLFPTCTSPYGNDSYFVLSNANLIGTTKRYLKPEERNVLCDIGYNVKTTYGVSSTVGGFFNYGGTACSGITVAGVNDGLNSNGTYTYTGVANSTIVINGATILSNDINTTGFECLQDISAVSNLSATTGTTSTTINFSSATTGLHILRYIPINGAQRGNITYLYVYIRIPANIGGCSPTPNTCNLVMNGDFEQTQNLQNLEIRTSCGWGSPGPANSNVVAGYYSTLPNISMFNTPNVPCNIYGFQPSNNNTGNGYAKIDCFFYSWLVSKQHLYTTLKTPLQANTNYQLSFDVSLADGFSSWVSRLQAVLHKSSTATILPINPSTDLTLINNSTDATTLLIAPTVTRNTNGWDTVTFNFTTTTGGEQFLYLGLLNNATAVSNNPAGTGIGGCTYQNGANSGARTVYYIDNVSLIPTNGAVLNLPASICNTQNLSNLSLYLNGTTATGVFSGIGVTFANGVYSFNASVAGVGTTTIGYTFTNSSGCSVTLYDTINISTTSSNNIIINAINDNFTNLPVNSIIGGVTNSVYVNDLYNGLPSTTISLPNVSFELVSPISISGASINSMGYINVPAGTPSGTYTLTYRIKVIGNCSSTSTASVTILVTNLTPNIVAGLRANDTVLRIGLQSSGKSIITGNFTAYNNIARNGIARLNTDVTLDTTFSSIGSTTDISGYPIQGLDIQSDDKIVVVGRFSGFSGGSNGANIARLLPNGSIDSAFNTGGSGFTGITGTNSNVVYTVKILSNGYMLAGGDFNWYNGIQRNSLVKIKPDGSVDTTFNMPVLAGYKNTITNIAIQSDGKVLVSGFFYMSPNGTYRSLIRLLSDGSIDTSFTMGNLSGSIDHNQIGVGGFPISKVILQPDGKIIVVGAFTKFNGTNVNCIARLLSSGVVDTSFITTTGVNRKILETIIESTTNKIIIGGEFDLFGTTPVKKMIRLNTNGTLDTSFSIGTGTTHSTPLTNCPYCRNSIWALKQQTDGKILVGGSFTSFNGLSATNITRIFGSAGVQAKSSAIEYQSEPEIDTNPSYNAIIIYPNPSKGVYTIDLTQINEPSTITLYNVLGELVYNQMLTPQTQNQIDLTHLANGYYIARINNESRSTQQKLIKN